MSRYWAVVPRSFAEVSPVADDVARSQHWNVAPASTVHDRVYIKGMSLFSWGSTMTVQLRDEGDSTRLSIDIHPTSLWGMWRARDIVNKFVGALGGALEYS